MRTISLADAELLKRLRAKGYEATPTQLERWRFHGLLPRPVVVHLGYGRGTRVVPHSDETAEAAAALSEIARPGVAWQKLGVQLFEHGFPLREDALQVCAIYLGHNVERLMKHVWVAATLAPASVGSRDDQFEDLAFAAAQLLIQRRRGRPLWLNYKALTRQALPMASNDEVELIAKSSLAMQIADAVGAGPLSAEQLQRARYFSDRGQSLVVRQPLISERQSCAATLTEREAGLFRRLVWADMTEDSDRAVLDLVVWQVTIHRLELEVDSAPPRPDRPLPTSYLSEIETDLIALEADLDEASDTAARP